MVAVPYIRHSAPSPDLLLMSAVWFGGNGFPVIPVHTPVFTSLGLVACSCGRQDCDSVGKHPRTRNGLKDASADVKVIKAWWTRWPDANIGIAVPPGYLIVDADGEDGIASLRSAGFAIDDTVPRVRTGGGGIHLWFRVGRDVRPKVAVLPHVDFRGVGSYVVAPPSLHKSGRRYSWEVHPDAQEPF